MAAGDECLTDAEYWVLLSLDDASLLAELLLPIVQVERRGSLVRRRWRERELRPKLEIAQAAGALACLVANGLVEVREVRERDERHHDLEALRLGSGPPLMVEPHPFDRGRPLATEEFRRAVGDPLNWRYPAEADAEFTYWAAITAPGEAAYKLKASEGSRNGPRAASSC
jgi:hypothetical protein